MSGFRDQPHTRAQGRLGEDEAVRWLKRRGYRIVARNFTCRSGEVDVIALDGDVLCFVEIKARANRTFGSAIEAISAAKQRKLARAAAWYLARHPHDGPCRFDVLGLDLEKGDGSAPAGTWRYQLARDAFQL